VGKSDLRLGPVIGDINIKCIYNAMPKGSDIQLWKAASLKPVIREYYLKKRKTCDMRMIRHRITSSYKLS
jgi:hypothetical protein